MKIFYLALLSAVCIFHTTLMLSVVANMMELFRFHLFKMCQRDSYILIICNANCGAWLQHIHTVEHK